MFGESTSHGGWNPSMTAHPVPQSGLYKYKRFGETSVFQGYYILPIKVVTTSFATRVYMYVCIYLIEKDCALVLCHLYSLYIYILFLIDAFRSVL